MTKNDLAKILSNILSSKKEADAVVDKLFEEMAKALKSEEKVVITGFGSFNTFTTRVKGGRNPKTGEKIMLAPRKKVRFKLSKDFFEE